MSAAQVLNSQLHIDTFGAFFPREYLKDELKARKLISRSNRKWGYCLQHKHFDLKEGEIILYTFREGLISAKIARIDEINAPTFPCVYFSFEGSFRPVGVCLKQEDALFDVPEHSSEFEEIGICSMSFDRGYVEYTNIDTRSQVFAPVSKEQSREDLMITMAFCNDDYSYCFSYTYCSVGIDINGNADHSSVWGHKFIPE